MKKLILSTFAIIVLMSSGMIAPSTVTAGPGDTTVVQTFWYDTTMRKGVFIFPSDTTITYEKIVMLYSMRCKDGLVSTSGNTNLGCGEWDYNCYTFLVDSTQTDSLRTLSSSHYISGSTDTTFDYTTLPVYSYIQYNQQDVTYNSVISETTATIGSGFTSITHPLGASVPMRRTQFLFTAAELTTAGFVADSITGMRLDLSALGDALNNLRIRVKTTAQSVLDPNAPETTGFTEVYFLNTSPSGTGMIPFNFHTPFWWDGTSNVIVEYSYTNAAPGTDNSVTGDDAGYTAALTTTTSDNYLAFNSNISYVKLNNAMYPSIGNEITIAFWLYGDPAALPANTYMLEAYDSTNTRQVNSHLPWNDSNVYWDCGNDGPGADRINQLATTSELEGKWNFWVFTKNVTTGTMSIYLNGALWLNGTGKIKPITPIARFIVGKGLSTNVGYFGYLDELSVWNKALNLASIQQIMYSDITPSHPDYAFLQVYNQFNESTGDIAYDASANGYDSELINPTHQTHNGSTIFRNFTGSNFRPLTTFVSGEYTTTVVNIPVLDSIPVPATAVIEYSVSASGHTLDPIDTTFVWPAGYSYIFDETGLLIDSIPVAIQSTINATSLAYYQARPMYMELINFITPYGINLNMNGLVGKSWAFDVTDFAPVLRGPRHIEMRDGIYQEDIDIKFVFYEGTPPRDVKSIQQIWPSGAWVSPSYNDITSNRYFYPVDIPLNPNASMYKLRSAISGHGQEGEFIARTHTLRLDNTYNYSRSVWKECATNPIYPQGGTWIYDRAGWCPGSAVDNAEYEITNNVTPGSVINLDYSLPVIANPGSSNYRVSNQLVSYGPANFTNDAAVNYIKTPTKRVEYARLNPLCNEPVISIKNTGSTQLTSLTITYGRTGGVMSTYNWTGALDFLQTAEVVLPMPAWTSSSIDEFVVYVSSPNGQADQYAWNDTLHSQFNIPAQLQSGLIFEFKTNNYYSHNKYTLKDSQGDTIIYRQGAAANTIYRDTVYLPNDCYTVYLTDASDDGLSFWANSAQGTGYFRIRNASSGQTAMSFNADFGDNIYQQFTVGYVLPVPEVAAPINGMIVYPNPASDIITTELAMPLNSQVRISMVNVLGAVVKSDELHVTNEVEKYAIDISGVEGGVYYIVAETDAARVVKKVVVAR